MKIIIIHLFRKLVFLSMFIVKIYKKTCYLNRIIKLNYYFDRFSAKPVESVHVDQRFSLVVEIGESDKAESSTVLLSHDWQKNKNIIWLLVKSFKGIRAI